MKKCPVIFLVDDNEVDNLVNFTLIKNLNITEKVIVLSNGLKAIEYLENNGVSVAIPSLILLDLNMPVMDGFEFLRKISALDNSYRERVKIVVLTSSLNEEDFQQAKDLGCDGYLVKPLTDEKILTEYEKVFYYE